MSLEATDSGGGSQPVASESHPHEAQPRAIREPRWPASLAVMVTLLLYVALPERLTCGPTWLLPLLTTALLLPLSIAVPERHHKESALQRFWAIALIATINLANVGSLLLLIGALLQKPLPLHHPGAPETPAVLHNLTTRGTELIEAAANVWFTNILVFALWYWELDAGGPGRRTAPHPPKPDFLFPQAATPDVARPGWRPQFVDYLYVAFTNATAFSPTDTLPLTPWAKMLMLVQALASLLTVALVAARAVNILT